MRLIRQIIIRISPPYFIGRKHDGFDNWLRAERKAAWDKGYEAAVDDDDKGQLTINPYN